jgi:hypothetical protein
MLEALPYGLLNDQAAGPNAAPVIIRIGLKPNDAIIRMGVSGNDTSIRIMEW